MSSLLTGLSSTLNPEKLDSNLDLESIERDLNKTETSRFEDKFPNFSSDLNLDVHENTANSTEFANTSSPARNDYPISQRELPGTSVQIDGMNSTPSTPSYSPSYSTPSTSSYSPSYSTPSYSMPSAPSNFAPNNSDASVPMPGNDIFEQETLEEEKERMLADIDELREELESYQVPTKRVPEVNTDSSYNDVHRVYTLLRRKYNRMSCEDMGNSFVMMGAKLLEAVFDGEKSYMGWRPDMTGWHRTVRSKMRRMGHERSVIVSNFMDYYNIGPMQRVFLELVPSALLHSMSRREQHGTENYNPDTHSEALDALRGFE